MLPGPPPGSLPVPSGPFPAAGQVTASAAPPPGVVSVASPPSSASVEPKKPKEKSKQRVVLMTKAHASAVAIHCMEGSDKELNTVPQATTAFHLEGNQKYLQEMSAACLATIQEGGQVPVLCPKPHCTFSLSGTNLSTVASHIGSHDAQEFGPFKKGLDLYHDLILAVYMEPGMKLDAIHKKVPSFRRSVFKYNKDLDTMVEKAKTKKINKKLLGFAALFALAMKAILPAAAQKAWGDSAGFPAKTLHRLVSQAALLSSTKAEVDQVAPGESHASEEDEEEEAKPPAKKAKVVQKEEGSPKTPTEQKGSAQKKGGGGTGNTAQKGRRRSRKKN